MRKMPPGWVFSLAGDDSPFIELGRRVFAQEGQEEDEGGGEGFEEVDLGLAFEVVGAKVEEAGVAIRRERKMIMLYLESFGEIYRLFYPI